MTPELDLATVRERLAPLAERSVAVRCALEHLAALEEHVAELDRQVESLVSSPVEQAEYLANRLVDATATALEVEAEIRDEVVSRYLARDLPGSACLERYVDKIAALREELAGAARAAT